MWWSTRGLYPEDGWSNDGWDFFLYDIVIFFKAPVFNGEGIISLSADWWKKGRVFSTSVSATREYFLVRGESFLFYRKGIFEAKLLFWYGDLGDGCVASRISETNWIKLRIKTCILTIILVWWPTDQIVNKFALKGTKRKHTKSMNVTVSNHRIKHGF